MNEQKEVNETDAERIVEFQRRLAAALKRILTEQSTQTTQSKEAHDEKSDQNNQRCV